MLGEAVGQGRSGSHWQGVRVDLEKFMKSRENSEMRPLGSRALQDFFGLTRWEIALVL